MAQKNQHTIDLEYTAIVFFMKIIAFVPYRLIIYFSKLVGLILYHVSSKSRIVSLINLKQAFPEKTFKERKKIALLSMQNMIAVFAEFLRSARMSDSQILRRLKIEGGDIFDKLLERNKGIVCITGHIGNWEYLAFYFAMRKYKPYIIVTPLHNHKLDTYLKQMREKRGSTCINRKKKEDLKLMFHALKVSNSPLAFLCDQNFLEGVYVDFFGCPAATPTGPIAMAMKTGSPIIIAHDVPNKNGYHHLHISEEFVIEEKGTKEETILHNTQRYTKELENIIRANPEHWIWSHGRWNTRPNNEPEIFYKKTDYDI